MLTIYLVLLLCSCIYLIVLFVILKIQLVHTYVRKLLGQAFSDITAILELAAINMSRPDKLHGASYNEAQK